jgi:hypothetical protein
MIINDDLIRGFYKEKLIKREIPPDIKKFLTEEEIYYLSEFGMPEGAHDNYFNEPIQFLNLKEVIISKVDYIGISYILLNIENHYVYRDAIGRYLGGTLKDFVYMAFLIDYFWKVVKQSDMFGGYYNNKEKYASWLEDELLKIDGNLHAHDSSYYWGSMLEGIEQGIFG